jgi:hypothetical protein
MDMLRMERIFHPVGQGAFYSEHFYYRGKRVNVVYDCGTLRGKSLTDREIKKAFWDGETVDAVFISHLHKDHISGIPDLIKSCDVKRIFFPVLTETDKCLSKIKAIVDGDDGFTVKFIDSPLKAIRDIESDYSKDVKLIGILSDEENAIPNSRSDIGTDMRFLEGIPGVCDYTLPSGVNVANEIHPKLKGQEIDWPFWTYVPYNFRMSGRIKMLIAEIENRLGISYNELMELGRNLNSYSDGIKKIKKSYKSITKDFNSHSMMLYSGSVDLRIKEMYAKIGGCKNIVCDCHCHLRSLEDSSCLYSSGCLYTGDYDMKIKNAMDELKGKYSRYWDEILLMQIPHHGSDKNYNGELVKRGGIYIISAGTGNEFRHPSGIVIRDICIKGGHPVVITEVEESLACFGMVFR